MAVTREEELLNSLANGVPSDITPITREEQYLSYIGGGSYSYPLEPITRKEALLKSIAEKGVSGGSGVTIKNQNKTITENGTYTADSGYTGLGTVTVDVQASSEGKNRFAQLVDRTIREVTAADLVGVTKIGSYAFNLCISLTNVILPDGVTVIESNAFENCERLRKVVIPEGVKSIHSYAFRFCGRMSGSMEITIPKSVETVGSECFRHYASEISVYISDLLAWCRITFDSSSSNPMYSAQTAHLYLNGVEITNLDVPTEVTELNYTFPSAALTSVKLHNGITKISRYCFYNCKQLTTVEFSENSQLNELGDYAFYRTSIENISLPSSLTKIGAGAFQDCSALKKVTLKATTPPTFGSYVFKNCAALEEIAVPVGCADAYKSATNWSAYADKIVEEGA